MAQGYETDGIPKPTQAGMFGEDSAMLMMGGLAVIAVLFGSKK